MKFEVTQELKDYIDLIDEKYQEAKQQKLSRLSVEWGTWSREMNLKTKNYKNLGFKYLFIYWVMKSQLLELHFKTRFKQSKKKQLAREAKNYRKIILSGNADIIDDDFLKRKLLKGIK